MLETLMHTGLMRVDGWQPDVSVIGPDGQVRLLVEAKARRDVDGPWATTWKQRFGPGASLRDVGLLLATPDRFFFWPPGASASAAPVEAEAVPALAPYLSAIAGHGRVDPMVFESVVTAWLEDCANGEIHPEVERLFGMPFLASLRRSSVVASGW